MSEIHDRDEFVLTVNRLMICAMEDIDCGRNEAGPTTLDLVRRIEDHDAALRAENERLRKALTLINEDACNRIDASEHLRQCSAEFPGHPEMWCAPCVASAALAPAAPAKEE